MAAVERTFYLAAHVNLLAESVLMSRARTNMLRESTHVRADVNAYARRLYRCAPGGNCM
jgi:hypothetical protein